MKIRSWRVAASVAFALAACQSSAGADAGASSSVATSGNSGSSSGGQSSSAGSASSGTGAGSSTGAATTGTTTGNSVLIPGPSCGQGRNWFGDICAAVDCAHVAQGASCALLPDGGFGICEGHACKRGSFDGDPDNCGAYGVQCPAGSGCLARSIGGCVVDGVNPVVCSQSSCPTGWTCVDYVGCVETVCDTEGTACLFDAGQKIISASQLGGCCGSNCVDLSVDSSNCGNCGLGCDAGQFCSGGVCANLVGCDGSHNGLPCAGDGGSVGSCCFDSCADLQSDPSNCGACSQGCGPGSLCSQGRCQGTPQCPLGSVFSNSVGACIPLRCARDAQGTVCAEQDAGNDQQMCCHGACMDVQGDDSENCGGCGLICPPGSVCVQGRCGQALDCTSTFASSLDFGVCQIPGSPYGGYCCGGSCVSIVSDDQNCDACGVACSAGSSCVNAHCRADAGTILDCGADAGSCPAETACTSSGCLPDVCQPLMFMQSCAVDGGRGACCGDRCVDTRSDPSNCATCGASCPAGAVCSQGQCSPICSDASCPAGTVCGDVLNPPFPNCVPLDCSALADGHICGFGEGSPLVAAGQLVGRGSVCCGGACVDNFQDPQNCGACGLVCPSGLCQNGSCVLSTPSDCQVSCGPGTVCAYGICVDSLCGNENVQCRAQSGNVGFCCGSGICADLQSDLANCGQCGVGCLSGQTCSQGVCSGSLQCGPGHVGQLCNLPGGPSFECCPGAGCTDIRFDADNCGGCGRSCRSGRCVAGVCG